MLLSLVCWEIQPILNPQESESDSLNWNILTLYISIYSCWIDLVAENDGMSNLEHSVWQKLISFSRASNLWICLNLKQSGTTCRAIGSWESIWIHSNFWKKDENKIIMLENWKWNTHFKRINLFHVGFHKSYHWHWEW